MTLVVWVSFLCCFRSLVSKLILRLVLPSTQSKLASELSPSPLFGDSSAPVPPSTEANLWRPSPQQRFAIWCHRAVCTIFHAVECVGRVREIPVFSHFG